VNCFRQCMFGIAVFLFLFLAAAVQPSIAQQEQPTHIFHRLIPAGNTCETCHKAIFAQWKASPHAENGLECTVCHGETTAPDFAGKPGLGACESCHSDQVAQLKTDAFMKGKTCVTCHLAHIFTMHKKTAAAGQ
jgi:hypothetical protein